MKKKAYNGARKLLLAVFPLLQRIYACFGVSLATDEMSRKEKIELLTTQIRAQREKPRVGGAHIVIFALLLCATSAVAAPSPESLRVMLHAAAGMSLLPQGGGGGTNSNLPFSGIAAPTGGCGAQQLFINYTTGDLYDCKATATWFKVNGGGGAGCSTSGLNKQVLYDDGAGGCLSSSILYNAAVSLDVTGLRVIAAEYDSDVANGATNGTIRIAKTDFIAWRNNANSANLSLGINASDQLVYNTTAQLVTQTLTNVSHKWVNSYDQTTGVLTQTQPDYSDLSGVPATFAPTAHNLLSASHGDTVAASPVRGDMIIANLTPAWTKLALGAATSGKYAKSNGTDIVISSGSAAGTGTCTTGVQTADNADAAPTCSDTPSLGTDNTTAGTVTLANNGAAAHTILASGATTTNTIKGFTVVPTTGNLLTCTSATTICTLTDAGILATNIVRKDAANAGAAAMTLDMSASTAANSLRAPAQAGLTAGADGVVAYDTTAKITHVRTNAADSLAMATTGTSTTTTQVVHATAVAGVYSASAIVDADIPAAITRTIANGTSALGTGAISSATCATVVTTSATGTATTDNIMADFNADPHAVTGYVPSASGMLTIIKYPTVNNVNFLVCNNTAGSITPGAITLNWRVVR